MLVAHGPPSADVAAGFAAPQSSSTTMIEAKRAAAYDGLAVLWNANAPSRPDKVLVAPAELVDVCLSPTKSYLAYGAMKHGAVCVWDLREPEGVHGGSATVLGLRVPSYTSGWQSNDLHTAPLRRIHVAGYNSATGHRNADEPDQLVSLDENGEVAFWMLSGDAARGNNTSGAVSSAPVTLADMATSKGLAASQSFTLSPSRRRAAAATEGDVGMTLDSRIYLYRAAGLNALDDIRAKNAAKKSSAAVEDVYPLDVDPTSVHVHRTASVTYDFDFAPTDASHLLVAGATAVHHVSKFGSITAPSQYAPLHSVTPATSLSSCPTDSRLLLVGYANGSVRLYLRDDPLPAFTAQLSGSAIVDVRWATNRRWLAFVLDGEGAVHLLDLAASNKAKPVATAVGSGASGRSTAVGVSYDERETRLAIGHASGVVEVHTVAFENVLALPVHRNEQWL
jgi:WD40 repeat protein